MVRLSIKLLGRKKREVMDFLMELSDVQQPVRKKLQVLFSWIFVQLLPSPYFSISFLSTSPNVYLTHF
jgi:hypothetical protein